jgi:hypothetical protein
VTVRPARNTSGAVQLEIIGADRQVLALVNIDYADVAVLSAALNDVAAEAEGYWNEEREKVMAFAESYAADKYASKDVEVL